MNFATTMSQSLKRKRSKKLESISERHSGMKSSLAAKKNESYRHFWLLYGIHS